MVDFKVLSWWRRVEELVEGVMVVGVVVGGGVWGMFSFLLMNFSTAENLARSW